MAVSVRYIVDDVDAAISFYCEQLGFNVEMHPAPAFAMPGAGRLESDLAYRHRPPGRGRTPASGRRAFS
jgi:catechol 2,3-dioxygenase-like lactoylglutathione lyase family enzyme